jgi:hypothetical protein
MTLRLVKRGGRPPTPLGKLAKSLGVSSRVVRSNGLDRDLSPLARKIVLNRIKRTKA